jgi:ribosomal protein L44E
MPNWTDHRRKARARRFEEPPPQLGASGRPLEQVRCVKCGNLLAEAEHFRKGEVIILPPGVPAPDPPPPDSVLVLRCSKCHEKRAAIVDLPTYPWVTNGDRKKGT